MEKEKNLKSNVKWKFIHYEYEKKQKYKSNLWKCWSAEKTDCNETQCFPGRFAACNIDQFEFIEFKCMKFIWFKYTEWKPLASIEMKIEYARVLWNIVERMQKCEFHQCFPEKLKKKTTFNQMHSTWCICVIYLSLVNTSKAKAPTSNGIDSTYHAIKRRIYSFSNDKIQNVFFSHMNDIVKNTFYWCIPMHCSRCKCKWWKKVK